MDNLETKQGPMNIIHMIDSESITNTMEKISAFQTTLQRVLKADHDYGIIPGTQKPTLFKPGAEKICMMFGLHPQYDFLTTQEDYNSGFFAYNIKCTLYKLEQPVAQGVGSCNSKEKRYYYINTDTLPPDIDPNTVPNFKDRYGRVRYKIQNPYIYDLANTILKMAKKRAFIDAVLQVASLSEIFTQDLEDLKDYIQEDKKETSSMTLPQAGAIIISFGKYKGKSLKDIFVADKQYFNWLFNNSKDPIIKKACTMILKSANSTS